jgi:hypothetical protein
MLIANSDWGLLEISTNVPVNLYDLVSVFRACEDYSGEAPTSLSGMVEVFKRCGLFDLTSLSRSEILIMGSRRECSKARAEAIMSVLDVRDWFTGDPKSREADLVMNLYPWRFVEEVRRKIGCLEFFGSMINPDADEWKVVYTKIAHGTWTVEDPGIRGSLLPFGRHVLPSSFFGPLSLAIPHPTLCNWEINKDGSVKISEVALVMITDNGKPNCYIVGPDLYYDWKEVVQYDGNLPRIFDLYFPEMPNYAVCLGIETITEGLRGVILKEVSAGHLIKVGNFLTDRKRVEGHEVELCYRQVNWILH